MKKIFLLIFVLVALGCLWLFFPFLNLGNKLSQDFTQESLDILTKAYKYELKEAENGASFSEILKYFPHLKLKDNYDLKYFTFHDMAGLIIKKYAVENGQPAITGEQWRMNPEVRGKLLAPIAAIQITENTAQAKQELAVFQMVLDTLFWSDDILFLDSHRKELLKKGPEFSLKEKLIMRKAYKIPTYEETPSGFKIRFLLFHDFGAAELSYITYEFTQDENGIWKLQKEETETLFAQPRRYII